MSFDNVFSSFTYISFSPFGLYNTTSYLVIFPLLSLALGMDHDTLMVFLPRGIITTSRGGPLGARNHERKKGISILTFFI